MKRLLQIGLCGCILLSACQKEARKAEFLILSTNEVKIEGSTEKGVEFSATVMLESDESILEQGFVYGLNNDPDLHDKTWLSWTLWFLGYPDQSLEMGLEAVAEARKRENPFCSSLDNLTLPS